MINWLRRLVVRYRDRHDPAARSTGLRFTTPRDFDSDHAERQAKASRKMSPSGRKYKGPSKEKAAKAKLYEFPREGAQ